LVLIFPHIPILQHSITPILLVFDKSAVNFIITVRSDDHMRNGNCTVICGEHSAATSNLFINRVESKHHSN
jgi:hypothetical protein